MPPGQLLLAAFLTWIAGFVDAVGFLIFARIYTANMSGNSVAFGIALNHRQWFEALFRFWPIFVYLIGLIVGRWLMEAGARIHLRHVAAIAFSIEIVLLSLVTFSDSTTLSWRYAAIALLAAAMGIQNSTLTRFSSLTLHTGFVTGTLVKFAEYFVACATVLWDAFKCGKPVSGALREAYQHKSFLLSLLLAFIWIAYALGAIVGAWRVSLDHNRALVYPIIALLYLVTADMFKPLSVEDEQEQRQLERKNP